MNPAKLKLLFITKHLELKDLVPWNVEEYKLRKATLEKAHISLLAAEQIAKSKQPHKNKNKNIFIQWRLIMCEFVPVTEPASKQSCTACEDEDCANIHSQLLDRLCSY